MIHPVRDYGNSLEDGRYSVLQLNSYRKELEDHLYAIKVKTLEIRDGQLFSQASSSGYFLGRNHYTSGRQVLASAASLNPLGIRDVVIEEKQITEVETLAYAASGSVERKLYSGTVLRVSAKTALDDIELSDSYIVPDGCFRIEYRCIWSQCGPSWAPKYACNFRCKSRACGNITPCEAPWKNTDSTIQCSQLVRFCRN